MTALFDTCSIITLDSLLQDRPSFARLLPKKLLVLEVSFSADQMRQETAERMRGRTAAFALPPLPELTTLLSSPAISKALSEVDKLVFATAAHHELPVVTEDERLAKAVKLQNLRVGNVALMLKDLVRAEKLTTAVVEKMLRCMADRKDCPLGVPNPSWNDLKKYKFPS